MVFQRLAAGIILACLAVAGLVAAASSQRATAGPVEHQVLLTSQQVTAAAKKKAATKPKTKKQPAKTAKPKEPEKPKETWQLPMKVVVVRGSQIACEPYCPQWIMAEGEITGATPGLFRKVLKATAKQQLPVIISSPGGSMNAAIEIGRMIRKAKRDVAVGATAYDQCGPFQKDCKLPKEAKGVYRGSIDLRRSFCNSACPLVLASGMRRYAGYMSYVGVHQVRTHWTQQRVNYRETYRIVKGKRKVISRKVVSRKTVKSYDTFGIDKGLRKKLNSYFKEMGVLPAIVDDMDKAEYTSTYSLIIPRREELKLITGNATAADLANANACGGDMPIARCVTDEAAAKAAKASAPAVVATLTNSQPGTVPVPTVKATKPAAPADTNDMTVVVVRDSGRGCEPLCPQWIAAEGVITPETPKLFKALFERPENAGLPVLIESTGGDFDAALEIGRMIRQHSADVAVASVGYIGCQPNGTGCKRRRADGLYQGFGFGFGTCSDACIFVLAAGKRRLAGSSVLTLHHPDSYISRTAGRSSAVELMRYFSKMGIDNVMLKLMHGIPRSSERSLTGNERIQTWIVTSSDYGQNMVRPDVCKASLPPKFCVKLRGAS